MWNMSPWSGLSWARLRESCVVGSIYFSASLNSDGIHQSWNKLQPNPEKDPRLESWRWKEAGMGVLWFPPSSRMRQSHLALHQNGVCPSPSIPVTKYQRKENGGRFILTHGFQGFSPQLWHSVSGWKSMAEPTHSPHSSWKRGTCVKDNPHLSSCGIPPSSKVLPPNVLYFGPSWD